MSLLNWGKKQTLSKDVCIDSHQNIFIQLPELIWLLDFYKYAYIYVLGKPNKPMIVPADDADAQTYSKVRIVKVAASQRSVWLIWLCWRAHVLLVILWRARWIYSRI